MKPAYQVVHRINIKVVGRLPKDIAPFTTISLWAPVPTESIPIFSLSPTSIKYHEFSCSRIAYWANLPVRTQSLSISYNSPAQATPPRSSARMFRHCLALQAPLTKVTPSIEEFANQFKRASPIETVKALSNHLADKLTYQYPPLTREANKVLSTLTSDCGGYHSLLVACLRYLGLPSVCDFGFRVGKDQPHVWSWWYDTDLSVWNRLDLNDMQSKPVDAHRISMAKGTGIRLNPAYPAPVSFIQGGLVWCSNLDKLKELGLTYSNRVHFQALRI